MSPVARKLYDRDSRIVRLMRKQQLQRTITAAIVHVDNFPGVAESFHRSSNSIVERIDQILFVVDRYHQRDHKSHF